MKIKTCRVFSFFCWKDKGDILSTFVHSGQNLEYNLLSKLFVFQRFSLYYQNRCWNIFILTILIFILMKNRSCLMKLWTQSVKSSIWGFSIEGDSTWKNHVFGWRVDPHITPPLHCWIMGIMSQRHISKYIDSPAKCSRGISINYGHGKGHNGTGFHHNPLSLPSLSWVCWNTVIVQIGALFIFKDYLLEMSKISEGGHPI